MLQPGIAASAGGASAPNRGPPPSPPPFSPPPPSPPPSSPPPPSPPPPSQQSPPSSPPPSLSPSQPPPATTPSPSPGALAVLTCRRCPTARLPKSPLALPELPSPEVSAVHAASAVRTATAVFTLPVPVAVRVTRLSRVFCLRARVVSRVVVRVVSTDAAPPCISHRTRRHFSSYSSLREPGGDGGCAGDEDAADGERLVSQLPSICSRHSGWGLGPRGVGGPSRPIGAIAHENRPGGR